jgi:hypothetical protein
MPSKRVGLSALLGAVLSVCTVLSSEPSRSAPGLTEVELKAVFLLRLPQFVSWPDQRPGAHFCVGSSSEVSALLSEMVASEPKGRTVRAVEVGDTEGCDVLYGDPALFAPDGAIALRVSDQPGFAQDGGMVELKRRGARMGLVVNLGALESAGLKASSKLLQLSEVVGDTQSD